MIGKPRPTTKVAVQFSAHETAINNLSGTNLSKLELTSCSSTRALIEKLRVPNPWHGSGSNRKADNVTKNAANAKVWHD